MMKLNPFGTQGVESGTSTATQEKRRPGRPSLPPEERARRREQQKLVYKRKDEARRRALNILQKRYSDEYKTLVEEQLRQNSI